MVAEGQIGQAIGRRGMIIRKLKKIFGKDVEIVEYSPNLEDFIRKLFLPARVNYVKVMEQLGKKIVIISVASEDKGVAIGRGGKNINRARYLAKRWFGVDNIKLIDKPLEEG